MFTLLLLGAAVYGGWRLNNYVSNIGETQKNSLKASISNTATTIQNKIENMTNKDSKNEQ